MKAWTDDVDYKAWARMVKLKWGPHAYIQFKEDPPSGALHLHGDGEVQMVFHDKTMDGLMARWMKEMTE